MSDSLTPLNQVIKIELHAPPPKGKTGLADMVTELKNLEAYIERINSKLTGGFKVPAGMSRSLDELKALFNRKLPTGHIGADALAKALGMDEQTIRMVMLGAKKELDKLPQYLSKTMEFKSAPGAAIGLHKAFQIELAEMKKSYSKFWRNLGTEATPGVSEVGVKSAAIHAQVHGQVSLVIPSAQIQASVSGPIAVTVPGPAVNGNGNGGSSHGQKKKEPLTSASYGGGEEPLERDAASMAQLERQAAAALRQIPRQGVNPILPPAPPKKTGGVPASPSVGQPGEYARQRVENLIEQRVQETITRSDALGNIVSETWDSVEQAIVRRVKKTSTGSSPVEKFRMRRALEEEAFRKGKAGLAKGDFLGLAQLQESTATIFKTKVLTPDLVAALGPAQSGRLQTLLNARADTLKTAGAQSRVQHREAIDAEIQAAADQIIKDQTNALRIENKRAAAEVNRRRKELKDIHRDTDVFRSGRGPFFAEMALAEEHRAQRLETAIRMNPLASAEKRGDLHDSLLNARQNVATFSRMGGMPPLVPEVKPSGERARLMSALSCDETPFHPVCFHR
jgi:hypothetical protein